MVRLRGGWNITTQAGRQFFYVDPAAYAQYRVDSGSTALLYRPASWQSGLADLSATLASPVLQRVNASVTVQRTTSPIFAEGSRGTDLRISGSLTLRPTSAARVEATLATSRITRRLDGSEYARTLIPRVKAEYQLTRAMFVWVVGEYRSERRDALRSADDGRTLWVNQSASVRSESSRLRLDWLASYQPTPGTVAFFGYGSGSVAPRADEFSELRRNDDAFFVKLAYQFRR